MTLDPRYRAAVVLQDLDRGQGDLLGLADELGSLNAEVNAGDLRRAEAVLATQANVLDALFCDLTSRALAVKDLARMETFLRLGLKAQSQSRATISALAHLKAPRQVAYVQQANIGQAVQVNNAPRSAEAPEVRPNELLEQKHASDWLDAGTAGATVRGDTSLEAVAAVDRATNAGREGQSGPERLQRR
jgi:hypothetical protein